MADEQKLQKLLGVGLYPPRYCALLTGVHVNKVNRWLFGRKYTSNGSTKKYPSLWEPEIQVDNLKTVSFRDLLEIRAIGQFLRPDLRFPDIRKAYEALRDELGEKYPFSSRKVKTDGNNIFHKDGIKDVLDPLLSNPQNMEEIIDHFFKDIDFEGDKPVLWWINGDRHIVLDPDRSFGKPIDDETRVPIAALYERVLAQGPEEAARYFEVSPECVKRAFEFQSRLMNPNEHLH